MSSLNSLWPALCFAQNHRLAEFERDFWKLCCPIPFSKLRQIQLVAQWSGCSVPVGSGFLQEWRLHSFSVSMQDFFWHGAWISCMLKWVHCAFCLHWLQPVRRIWFCLFTPSYQDLLHIDKIVLSLLEAVLALSSFSKWSKDRQLAPAGTAAWDNSSLDAGFALYFSWISAARQGLSKWQQNHLVLDDSSAFYITPQNLIDEILLCLDFFSFG